MLKQRKRELTKKVFFVVGVWAFRWAATEKAEFK
jgi:hypothetical protein